MSDGWRTVSPSLSIIFLPTAQILDLMQIYIVSSSARSDKQSKLLSVNICLLNTLELCPRLDLAKMRCFKYFSYP